MFLTTGVHTSQVGIITHVVDEGSGNGVFQWSVNNVTARRAAAIEEGQHEIFSPPFQHPIGGYKMRLVMHPNAYNHDEDSHVSLCLELLPGLNDDQLEWPFALPCQFSAVNHGGGETRTVMIDPTIEEITENWKKPTIYNRPGLGLFQFIKRTDLPSHLLKDEMTININILQKGQSNIVFTESI